MAFLRKSRARDPLPVTMSGVRMGERLLQIGVNDPQVAGKLAAKVGLTGHAVIVVADDSAATRAKAAVEEATTVVELHVASLHALPFADDAFDAIVVHSVDGLLAAMTQDARAAAMRDWRRVLRSGGRLVVIETGTRTGLAAVLRPAKRDDGSDAGGGTVAALEAAGFKPVRMLGDREGLKFAEGLKTA